MGFERHCKLPYGPVGLWLGFEHRSEQGHYHPDPLVSTGQTLENTQQPTAGGFNASEISGELHVPILANLPFAKDLSASASGRWSDYNTFGSTQTWKVGLNWTPVRDIRFRANLGTAFRQPGINELYGGQALSFNSANDPCANAASYGAQSGIVSGNCRTQGIDPATFQQSGSQIKTLQGGNPALQPETARTYTIGTVLTPRWIPSLSLSIDYYHTQIAHSIGSVDTQTIVDSCYTSTGLSNQFCSLLSGRDASGQLKTVSALNQNLGVTRTNGIDLSFSYLVHLPGSNTLTLSDDMEKLIGFSGQNLPDGPFINYTGTEYYPRLRNTFAATITHGRWSFSYTQRFIDGMNFYPGTTYAPGRARVYRYNEVFYHDIMAGYHGRKMDILAGIDNVADKTPLFKPLGAINTNGDI